MCFGERWVSSGRGPAQRSGPPRAEDFRACRGAAIGLSDEAAGLPGDMVLTTRQEPMGLAVRITVRAWRADGPAVGGAGGGVHASVRQGKHICTGRVCYQLKQIRATTPLKPQAATENRHLRGKIQKRLGSEGPPKAPKGLPEGPRGSSALAGAFGGDWAPQDIFGEDFWRPCEVRRRLRFSGARGAIQ